jgi:hypothetical protein
MYTAEITYVHDGIEYRQTVEDDSITFYARICGVIEGITRGGAQVTLLSTMSDTYATVSA